LSGGGDRPQEIKVETLISAPETSAAQVECNSAAAPGAKKLRSNADLFQLPVGFDLAFEARSGHIDAIEHALAYSATALPRV
jgi:hypothetical protein